MIHQKNEYQRLGVPFAEPKKDVNSGDLVLITGESQKIPNKFNPERDRTVIKIETKNGNRRINLNQKSINILIGELGSNNDKDWVGKEVKVLLNPASIGGKRVVVAYLVGKDWELDEYGEPTKPGNQPETEDLPVIDADEKIDIKDVPF